jgi:hypothetical protein
MGAIYEIARKLKWHRAMHWAGNKCGLMHHEIECDYWGPRYWG